MNIVKPNATYLDPDESSSPYAFIERIGRTCYKSEDKITSESAVGFIKMLIEKGHIAMLEHVHIIMNIDSAIADTIETALNWSLRSRNSEAEHSEVRRYFNITLSGKEKSYISASIRTFLELFSHKYLMTNDYIYAMYQAVYAKYPEAFPVVEGKSSVQPNITFMTRREFVDDVKANHPTNADVIIKKHLPHTILFTVDRGVTHEIVRHRPASYAQESTRYCNYTKGKFGNQITVVKPCFWDEESEAYKKWIAACENAEKSYFELIEIGATPQEARSILPHSVKADIIVTATEAEWQHILNLRYKGTTGAPHPSMKEVMTIAVDDLVKYSDGRLK